ncbi:MAG: hypothetical protein AAFX04_00050 [Pseudomonadota bacterium]
MRRMMDMVLAAGLMTVAAPLAAQQDAATDPNAALVNLTCADFNTAARIAVVEEDASPERIELAEAAQDDIAYALTWMHGYFYAYKREKMPQLNQAWLKETAEALARKCGSVENPQDIKIIDLGAEQ